MTTLKKKLLFGSLGVAIALLAWSGYILIQRLAPESSPVARGAATSGVYGCLSCHGKDQQVPPNDRVIACTNTGVPNHTKPSYLEQCSDVMAFFNAVRLRDNMDKRLASTEANDILKAEQLARQYYCFGCHGELGQGGLPNPGALKGYIPGYFGEDFRVLTSGATPKGVENWIRHGTNPELLAKPIEGPIAEYYIERQNLQMPPFDSLPEQEIKILVDYLILLNHFGPLDVQKIVEYERLSIAPPTSKPNSGGL